MAKFYDVLGYVALLAAFLCGAAVGGIAQSGAKAPQVIGCAEVGTNFCQTPR